ncbi:putative ribosomal protein L22/L17 [Helianthus annuus]|nr:putative ribosomal protein L22/L17 [Helianthus annuus]
MPYRACCPIFKLVYSAVANASSNMGSNEANLVISKAEVNKGTIMKILKPRARGRRSTRTEIKHWVELFFGVKVIAMNSHRLRGKARRMGPIMGMTMHYRRMIITLQPGHSIPPLRKKRT